MISTEIMMIERMVSLYLEECVRRRYWGKESDRVAILRWRKRAIFKSAKMHSAKAQKCNLYNLALYFPLASLFISESIVSSFLSSAACPGCLRLLGAKGQHICCSNAATRQFTCAWTWSAKFDLIKSKWQISLSAKYRFFSIPQNTM